MEAPLRGDATRAATALAGPTGPQAALTSLVDELDWVFALLAPPAQMPVIDVCRNENADAFAAVVEALRATGATEQAGRYALVAKGRSAPELDEPRPVRAALQATERATVEHTNPRDVWFRRSAVGWRVGLVRIEDVAIGFAISLGVGLLFWPRGAAALLRENLAAAYARNAD